MVWHTHTPLSLHLLSPCQHLPLACKRCITVTSYDIIPLLACTCIYMYTEIISCYEHCCVWSWYVQINMFGCNSALVHMSAVYVHVYTPASHNRYTRYVHVYTPASHNRYTRTLYTCFFIFYNFYIHMHACTCSYTWTCIYMNYLFAALMQQLLQCHWRCCFEHCDPCLTAWPYSYIQEVSSYVFVVVCMWSSMPLAVMNFCGPVWSCIGRFKLFMFASCFPHTHSITSSLSQFNSLGLCVLSNYWLLHNFHGSVPGESTSLPPSFLLSLTHSLTHSLIHSLTLPLSHLPQLLVIAHFFCSWAARILQKESIFT